MNQKIAADIFTAVGISNLSIRKLYCVEQRSVL
jgi:hypothetical protein